MQPCNRAYFLTSQAAYRCLEILDALGWLRGEWHPVLCECGRWHCERVK